MATVNENVKGSEAKVIMDTTATTTAATMIALSPPPTTTTTTTLTTTTTTTSHNNSRRNNDESDSAENNLLATKNCSTESTQQANSDYVTQPRIQPMIEYYYENQGYSSQPNCFMFSTMSYPFLPNLNIASPSSNSVQKQENWYYQFINNIQGYRWVIPRDASYFQNVSNGHLRPYREAGAVKYDTDNMKLSTPSYWCKGDSSKRLQSVKYNRQKVVSSKMHPVQLLHQIFRKEAFVMEYERINDGPFSQVRVTYKVNGKSYTAEATRLKEA
jgi:hypothetical protein